MHAWENGSDLANVQPALKHTPGVEAAGAKQETVSGWSDEARG